MTRTFDRLVSYDDKSLNFPIRTLVGDKPLRSYTWRHVQLDQGNEGACTGFSATMEAAARPAPYFGDPVWVNQAQRQQLNQTAMDTYHRARQLDEWPGEDYEGSSVLGATKAGMENKWWKEYRWALGPGAEAAAQDVILAIGWHGPVMMGSYWWNDMFEADAQGYLHPTGGIAGGHAWLLTGYSIKRDAVWTPNSWGGEGQGWIKRADLVALLENDGEACVPVVRNRKPAKV